MPIGRKKSPERTATASAIPLASHPYRFLGSYRFLLAVLVLTSHASGFLGATVASLQLGNVGVFLFFVVSGAVICEALDIFYHDSSHRFLINRALKIFPAYWAIALLYAMIFILLNPSDWRFDPWAIIVNVSLLLSYLPAGNNKLIIDIAWAVVVECQFYLIAAALFFVARVTRMFGRILYAGGLVALALYLFIHITDGHARFYGAFRFAPYFVLGSASYYTFTRMDLRTGLLAMLAGILSLHAYLVYSLATPSGGLPLDLSAYSTGQIASTALFAAGTFLFLWLFSRGFRQKAEQVDKRLGDITYSIYLIHPLIIYVAIDLNIADRFGNATAYLFTLLVSATIAVLIFRGIERPVMKLRNRFRGRRLYD